MFLPLVHYEIANNEPYTVVAETTTREESEEYLKSKRLYESCFVSKEQGQELYRVICEVKDAQSNAQ